MSCGLEGVMLAPLSLAWGGSVAKNSKRRASGKPNQTVPYKHPGAKSLMRPEVGTQAQFKKKKPPKTYRYDSSLSPALDWDATNPAREQGEALIASLETKIADLRASMASSPSAGESVPPVPSPFKGEGEGEGESAKLLREADETLRKLKALSKPFLNWAGKAERLSFDVPTLPLFIHERLSTKAIIETLAGHKTDKQEDMFALFGDPQHSITDQVLKP